MSIMGSCMCALVCASLCVRMCDCVRSIGDDRAAQVRRKYGKPLKAVIIQDAGELPLPVTQTPAALTAVAP